MPTEQRGAEGTVGASGIVALATLGTAVLAACVFLGLAALGNEWRLRNEEWAPDEPDWSEV